MESPLPSTSKVIDPLPDEFSENEPDPVQAEQKPLNISPGAIKLRNWLNKTLRVEMSDGRILIGVFLCTDRDANIILGSCSEYLPEDSNSANATANCPVEEPRMLGLVMVPGKHIVNICIDQNELLQEPETVLKQPLSHCVSSEDVM